MNANLFINYRREDTAPYAGRLYDRLTAHFSQDQVFIDIDQIEPGEDFVEAINRKVGTCDIAIVTIGPNWLNATDASGKRRLDDEEDFVRMEIVAALQRKVRVIPVLVGGAHMPRKQDLPEALAPLSRRNAIELSETRFHADVNRLIEAIEKSVAVAEQKAELSATPVAPVAEPAAARPPESKVLPEASGSAAVDEREAGKKAEAEAARLAEKERQATQLAELKLAEEKKAAEAEAARLADEERKLEEAARAGAERKAAEAAQRARLANEQRRRQDTPYWESEGNQQDTEEPTTPVKSTQTPPAIPPVAWISAIAALKEPAVWIRKRLIIVAAIAATVVLLLAITWSLTRPHPSVGPSELSKPAQPNQGDAAAQFNLGVRYEDGQGVPKDLEKAAELYRKASNQGHAGAQFNLGLLYAYGEGVPKDLGKAAELYQKAADQGNAAAQGNLGVLYEKGEGVTKDLGKAVELYQKAADQGNTVAKNHLADAQFQIHLGLLYQQGDGVPKDLGKAAELYQKAADQGDAAGQNRLGWLYQKGWGVPMDLVKARELYQKAANQGYGPAINAQYNLGVLYEKGEGVTKDLGKAAELYQKAADQGNSLAQNHLGWLYENGQGVPKDLGKAVELYQKAADQGYARAQYNLGLFYEDGQGVPKDLAKAAEFYQKAANQGDQDAIANLKRLSTPSK